MKYLTYIFKCVFLIHTYTGKSRYQQLQERVERRGDEWMPACEGTQDNRIYELIWIKEK